ncbi:MAG: gliding motility-associated C-terminal domain-containing protein [Prevotellaceae bacterium]|jgi:gliding motility-associated-like protein|nr:gliding motility-associated C-terminal domain-containing protein [Prevotellaceae bacterium]
MRSIGTIVLILSILGLHNIAGAQCDFDLAIEVVQNSTCVSNGIIKVTLSGDEIDTGNVSIFLSKSGSSPLESIKNGNQFELLSPGTYNVTAIAQCKNSSTGVTKYGVATIDPEYNILNAIPAGQRSSLNCINTGTVSFDIWDGTPPYSVKITTKPDKYTGTPEFTLNAAGTVQFDALAPGEYVFEITDNCLSKIKPKITIDNLEEDFPLNLYREYLNFQSCSRASVETVGNLTDPYNIYWEEMRNEYYRIAFSVDETRDWLEFPLPLSVDLPEPYRKLHAEGKEMYVYVRLKDAECEKIVDTIKFSDPPKVSISRSSERSCGNYKLDFKLDNEYSLCTPIEWAIVDDLSGDTLAGEKGIENFDTRTAGNLLYDKSYTLTVIDASGVDTVRDKVSYSSSQAGIMSSVKKFCDGYELSFRMDNESAMCAPFKWEVIDYDSPDDTVAHAAGIDNFDTQTVGSLLDYGKNYIIKVSDTYGRYAKDTIISESRSKAAVMLNEPNKSCGDYEISFYMENETLMCPPFRWEVFDGAGNLIDSDFNDDRTTVPNLSYDTPYKLLVTDDRGNSTDTVSFSSSAPETVIEATASGSCENYELNLDIKDAGAMCQPLTWTVIDESNGAAVPNSGPGLENIIPGLSYNKDYRITAVDANGKKIDAVYVEKKDAPKLDYHVSRESEYSYDVDYTVSDICPPYRWEVWEKDPSSHIKDSIINCSDPGDPVPGCFKKTVDSLEYGKEYIIMIIDNAGDTLIMTPYMDPPERTIEIELGGGGNGEEDELLECNTYGATVTVSKIRTPYDWYVCRENGDTVSSGKYPDSSSPYEKNVISGLEYDSIYIIRINDGITDRSDTIKMGDMKFPMPYFSDEEEDDYRCEDYRFRVNVNNVYCPPYRFTVRNRESGDTIRTDTVYTVEKDIPHPHSIRLPYDSLYEIIVTDVNGNDTIMEWSKKTIKPGFINLENTGLQCRDYEFRFTLDSVYCPYKWEVINTETGEKLISPGSEGSEDYATPSKHAYDHSIRLPYDTVYEIRIRDGKDSLYTLMRYRPPVQPFFIDKGTNMHLCDYEASFDADSLYCEYQWKVVNDSTGEVVYEGYNSLPNSVRLQYDTAYTVTITDVRDSAVSKQYREEFPKPDFSGYGARNYGCEGYEFYFKIANLECLPYKWEITGSNGDSDNGDSEDDFGMEFQYGVDYTIRVSDRLGHDTVILYSKSENDRSAPEFDGRANSSECHEYEYIIDVTHISCFPYQWKVTDSEGTVVDHGEDVGSLQEHPVMIKYEEDYVITVTDATGKYTDMPKPKDKDYVYKPKSFYLNSGMSKCISESFKGYIEISGDMYPGARIRFIEGPQTPVNSDVTLDKIVPYFYPFSDDYEIGDSIAIEQGDYTFEITDMCGDMDTYVIEYRKTVEYVYAPFVLDEETGLCLGRTYAYPKGEVYINGNPAPKTWFALTESPSNITGDYIIDGNNPDAYFIITQTGRYVFEVRTEQAGCPVDTVVLNHVQKKSNLDGSSAYMCGKDDLEKGNIRVLAKDGKPPYIYTLLDGKGEPVEGVAPNDDGIFQYGSFGETYFVEVTDACDKSFQIEVQIGALEQMTLLSGTTNLCAGEEIQINCLLLGATGYEWTGPDGFSSTEQNISIPDATVKNSGIYEVKILPSGCGDEVTKSIEIKVHDVPAPEAQSPVEKCVSEADYTLEAQALENHSLQWYSKDHELLPEAPTISLREIKDTVFYVTQTMDVFSCVSEEKEITVRINPLPEKNANAAGWSCENGHPQITVTGVIEGYQYTVYDDAEATNPVHSFTGGATDETMVETMTDVTVKDEQTFYLKTATAVGCTLPSAITEVLVEISKLSISPDELPVYIHDNPYSVQLESDAVQPVYTTADNLVTGIILEPDGLIHGTVPRSAGYEERPFTVTVTDEKGCQAAREYLLRSCGPAPEITYPEIQLCEGAQPYPLQVSVSDGLHPQWLDAEKNELSEAIPSTAEAGEQLFYVVQINDALLCTSDTAEIKVKITPPPKPDFDAPDVNVCYGSSPLIHLSNLHETYTYNIYSDLEMTDLLETITGETSADLSLSSVPEDTSSYYIRITDSLTCVSTEFKEVKANVIKLYILPDELPVYKHETPYSVQLESNAIQPEFRTDDDLLPGISLNIDGLISGTVPRETGYEEAIFTVRVTDENSCEASREYLLQNCGPAPETPFADVYNCIYSQSDVLQASSPEGLPLQWYDAEFNKLPEAPTPLTDLDGEQVFYVSQITEALQCESDMAKISVFTIPLPLIDFKASAADVCFQSSSSILLEEIDSMSIYSVYPDKTFGNELAYLTGTNSGSISLNDILENRTSYYILRTDSLGCVSSDWMEVSVDVIKLYIEPDELPPYIKDSDYEQQLISNAQSPAFSIVDGHLPDGLILNTYGLIYGNVPNSYREVSNTVTVEVQDLNGCRTAREYVFNGNVFVPKVFTPNGDGINDVFMQGYRLVIFDRLGIIIFEGNNGWDGTYKGKPVADDIYFYKLEYLDSSETRKITTGYIGVHH